MKNILNNWSLDIEELEKKMYVEQLRDDYHGKIIYLKGGKENYKFYAEARTVLPIILIKDLNSVE